MGMGGLQCLRGLGWMANQDKDNLEGQGHGQGHGQGQGQIGASLPWHIAPPGLPGTSSIHFRATAHMTLGGTTN